MKQSWTRLANICDRNGVQNKEEQFKRLFLKHHYNAQEIFVKKDTGEPLFAIYVTPIGSHQEMFKSVMRELRNRMEYGYTEEE